MLDVTIPNLRLVSEANAHEHFWKRTKRANEHHAAVEAALQAWGPKPSTYPLLVIITRYAPAKLDSDNLQGSAKHVRDAVAEWLGIDDKCDAVLWFVAQVQQSKTYACRIFICPRNFHFRITPTGLLVESAELYSTTGLDVEYNPNAGKDFTLCPISTSRAQKQSKRNSKKKKPNSSKRAKPSTTCAKGSTKPRRSSKPSTPQKGAKKPTSASKR